MYQAFYRAYRPQSFEEMSGQEHVRKTLQNELALGKTTHAYVFSGPRGTGKTSAAKIFAKALNCERGPAPEPCNDCATCTSITAGSHPDVIEFDAASNSRVEEIREVIEKVRFAPASARFKVYIIDEVHMLSTSAFNALLKTLEEPPEHAVFILATTEPHKLPATILSRCQRFEFRRLSVGAIIARMEAVLADAGIASDERVLKLLAKAADGGMRDALSMLDQVVSFGGGHLRPEDALLVTGSIGQEAFCTIADALLASDAGAALAAAEALLEEGKDPLRLAEDFLSFCRDLLVMQAAPAIADRLEAGDDDMRFRALADFWEAAAIRRAIGILARTLRDMKQSNQARLYLEAALIELADAPDSGTFAADEEAATAQFERLRELEQRVQELERQLREDHQPPAREAERAMPAPRARGAAGGNGEFQPRTPRIFQVLAHATKQDLQVIRERWAAALAAISQSQSALLEESEPVAASPEAFVLKLKYEINCRMVMERPAVMDAFREHLISPSGAPYEVLLIADTQWPAVRKEYIEHHMKSETGAEPLIGAPGEAEEDPIVAEAHKLFGKDFVDILES